MNVTIYRHAQSKANAGEVTDNPGGIALTPLGIRQAELLSRRFERAPTLLVTSPYIRTEETAAPIRARFPDVPHQEWPIQEFTYLAPGPLRGTSRLDRQELAAAFWKRMDPSYRDGPGAESLSDLFGRVQWMIDRLERIDTPLGDDIAIFGHGMFMRALMWCLLTNSYSVNREVMQSFWSFCFSVPTPNTVAMPLLFANNRWFVGSLSIGHLQVDMVTI